MPCFADDSEACQFVSLGAFLDASGKVGRVEVIRCQRCGHGISMPPLPDVGFLYEERESQDFQPDAKGLARAIKNVAFRLQARKLWQQLGRSNGRILDFGCGSGQFTRILGEVTRPAAKVVGADMHADPPGELTSGAYLSLSDLRDKGAAFDVVIAMHVLEHDNDVTSLLATLAGYARPGGKVVIEVPNVDCVWADWFGRYWDPWYLPYHRQHFSRVSLIAMMQRSGLEIDSVYSVTVPSMGRTFANLARRPKNVFWLLLGIVAHPIQLAGETLTGRPTAFRVIATKR
jgi:SAM-dependent methyltransferase